MEELQACRAKTLRELRAMTPEQFAEMIKTAMSYPLVIGTDKSHD